MPKINQEEYETLKKKQEKGHKYIAREKEGHVIVFTDYHGKSEYRWLVTINEDDLKYESLFNSSKVFQFIKWEDESPYNISELIEEYLYDNRPKLFIDGQEQSFEFIEESEEEEMKKGIEWLKREIHKELEDWHGVEGGIDGDGINEIMLLINQLDEPEVLSQKWISENVEYAYFDMLDGSGRLSSATAIIKPKKLQNLLVPKQELPVIPKFVAEWIEETKPYNSLRVAFEYIAQRKRDNHDDELAFWVEEGNSETFARAWLDGYEIEQEPKYYAKIKGHENIGSNDKYWNYNTDMEELSIGDSEVHPNVISEYMVKATKDEWANLGITDDNADFELVEELKECRKLIEKNMRY